MLSAIEANCIQEDWISISSSVNTYLENVLCLIWTYSCKNKSHNFPDRFLLFSLSFDVVVATASHNDNVWVRRLLENATEIMGSSSLPFTIGNLQQSSISYSFWNWYACVSINCIQCPSHFLWWDQSRAFGQPQASYTLSCTFVLSSNMVKIPSPGVHPRRLRGPPDHRFPISATNFQLWLGPEPQIWLWSPRTLQIFGRASLGFA